MSWEMHEAAKKIADGWYSELETTRKRNAVLGRENAELRELAVSMLRSIKFFEACSDLFRVSSVYEQLMRELGVEIGHGDEG